MPVRRLIDVHDVDARGRGVQRLLDRAAGGVLFGGVGVPRDAAFSRRDTDLVDAAQFLPTQCVALAGARAGQINVDPIVDEPLQILPEQVLVDRAVLAEYRRGAALQSDLSHARCPPLGATPAASRGGALRAYYGCAAAENRSGQRQGDAPRGCVESRVPRRRAKTKHEGSPP